LFDAFFRLAIESHLSSLGRYARPVLRLVAAALGAAVLVAAAGAAAAPDRAPRRTVTVMTRNLYLGASLDPILHAKSAPEAFGAVSAAWAQVQANDFPQRARAIAAELARAKPDFVGLQEVPLYRTQTPSDFQLTRATTVALDYRRSLMDALRARRLAYRFVSVNVNTDAEFPSGFPPSMDVRLTMRNAILMRTDRGIKLRRARAGNYATTLPVFGGLVTIRRGWAYVDATVGGRTFRFIDTHLEAFNRQVQEQQSKELLAGPAATRLPVVLVGDLNSRPDASTTASYVNLTDGGFADTWLQAYPKSLGLTCCHGDDLREPAGPFYERIDYVLERGGLRGVRGAVTGQAPSTRTGGGLWPSDHGGLWMTLRLPTR
jgi:endonuclease/exonuclease/phosphatase family metal-dependent hydrolase